MHSISDLKELFIKSGIERIFSQGWYLDCCGDRWTMLNDVYYLNGKPVSKKDIQEYAKNPPKAQVVSLKMMRAKDYFEQEVYDECESIEIDVE